MDFRLSLRFSGDARAGSMEGRNDGVGVGMSGVGEGPWDVMVLAESLLIVRDICS